MKSLAGRARCDSRDGHVRPHDSRFEPVSAEIRFRIWLSISGSASVAGRPYGGRLPRQLRRRHNERCGSTDQRTAREVMQGRIP